MYKDILHEMLSQNRTTCSFAFSKIESGNMSFRVNEQAASVRFIYRHIGETINMFGLFFGVPTDVQNTTIGQKDIGQHYDLQTSHLLVQKGYEMLENLVQNTPDSAWLNTIETPFFGTIPRIRLFSHILYHNSHHAGQISLTLSKDKKV